MNRYQNYFYWSAGTLTMTRALVRVSTNRVKQFKIIIRHNIYFLHSYGE